MSDGPDTRWLLTSLHVHLFRQLAVFLPLFASAPKGLKGPANVR